MKQVERLEKLMDRARAGERPMGMSISFDCVSFVELAPKFGFEWLLIDQEHTLIQGARYLADMIRAADWTGLPHFVKVNDWDPLLVRDALDLGTYGIQVPFVETAEQLREMDRAIRHPRRGNRGFCAVARSAGYSSEKYTGLPSNRESIAFANEHALLIPTIENARGLENIDELMAVDECPIWHIGFTDLTLSLGLDPEDRQDANKSKKIFVDIAQKIHAAGKMVMAFMVPIEGQRQDLAEGIELLGNDLPYALDMACAGFGMAEMMNIWRANEALRRANAAAGDLELDAIVE